MSLNVCYVLLKRLIDYTIKITNVNGETKSNLSHEISDFKRKI